MRELVLSGNNLTGPIPPQIGQLSNLTELNLCWNHLTGHIPSELGQLTGLTILSLCRNNLTGPIHAELGSLKELTRLELFFNQLTGPIPPVLGQLTALESIDLAANNLTGPLPPELFGLTDLTSLVLHSNRLVGPLPPELSRLTRLMRLSLSRNSLTGSIPPELGSLARLTQLELQFNELTGPIPPELGELSALNVLWLLSNQLKGPLPSELGQLQSLEHLRLDNNNLWGPLPRSFLQLDGLRVFGAGDNEGLCVPGTGAFVEWLDGVSVLHDDPYCNAAEMEGLAKLYERSGGGDWVHSGGWLESAALDGWYGVAVDSLGRVLHLDLARNGLVGELPASLGNLLTHMTESRLDGNDLSGPLPLSLARLALSVLHDADTDLCVPADRSFQAWLNAIPSHHGTGKECHPLSQREILIKLHEATEGPNWINLENWSTDAPLGSWYGVEVDQEGQVTQLDLGGNHLTGTIPAELGRLAQQRVLNLANNALTGAIPPELGSMAMLRVLDLERNQLAGRIPPELGSLAALEDLNLFWNTLSGHIPSELGSLSAVQRLNLCRNDLRGRIPRELGNLATLKQLSLCHNRVSGEIPVEFGSLSNLEELHLFDNDLTGPIPAELGKLERMQELWLDKNRLRHAIPRQLGNLFELRSLSLGDNDLIGPIPPELGNLVKLTDLVLWDNDLAGPIPPELGNLSELESLSLSRNDLTGPIPSQFGKLDQLHRLDLDYNGLGSPIPPELGNLTALLSLNLRDNKLTGPVPAEFDNLANLRALYLAGNGSLAGPLPVGLTSLQELGTFTAGGTDLCAPPDPGFLEWLKGIENQRVPLCVGTAAYLTQAVQSMIFPTPLVAGDQALLRVFVTATRPTSVGIPAVRATFFVDDRVVHTTDIPGQPHPIPTKVDESSLSKSANAIIPGWVVQPGLGMVIEVDPAGEVDPSLGVKKRIPETGRLGPEVQPVPSLDLTLIPFLWSEDPDSAIVDLVKEMAADPEDHELLVDTRTLLPVHDVDVIAHEPVLTSTNNARTLFYQTEAIRVLEGGQGHYQGMMSGSVTGPQGVGYAPGRVSFSIPDPRVMAHELGHNMSLLHAPCGARDFLDPSFPEPDGTTGTWGYDFREDHDLVEPSTPDFMSYCVPYWTSEYSFTKALRHRLRNEEMTRAAPPTRSVLLWGGVNAEGDPFLEPAFVVDAPTVPPGNGGDYRLEGTTDGGLPLFSVDFEMPQVVDGDGARAFAFVLPVEPGWAEALASITLSGPGGSVTLDKESDRAVAILIDTRRHEVRGMLHALPDGLATEADIAAYLPSGPGLELLFSRGIPDASAWPR